MAMNSSSVDPVSQRSRTIEEQHGYAVAFFFLGVSQIVLSFNYVGTIEFVIIASGGWLLLGLSESILRGRMAFESWIPNGRIHWILLGGLIVFGMTLMAVSLSVLLF